MQLFKKYGSLIATITAVLALVFYLVLPVFKNSISLIKLFTTTSGGFTTTGLILLIATLLALILSIAFAAASFKKASADLVAIIVLVVSVVLVFLTKTTLLGDAASLASLGTGPILAAIFNIIGIAVLVVKKLVK